MLDREEYKKSNVKSMRIPIGKPSIKSMIEHGFYADKTAYVADLFEDDGAYYFLTRPRRFGKSLLLDTIDQIAKGEVNKALFKGCAIYKDQTHDWKKYPVIRLNFSVLNSRSADQLEKGIQHKLNKIAKSYGLEKNTNSNFPLESYLEDLIDELIKLGNGYENKVIVLIDEYDSPLIKASKEQYESNLNVIDNFLSTLKACQPQCKFIFMTGVFNLSVVGIGSGANSARDISLHKDFSELTGYTEDDMEALFFKKEAMTDQVVNFFIKNNVKPAGYTTTDLRKDLKNYYNGYCFGRNGKPVYNPDSILKFFDEQEFKTYWSHSGNPATVLTKLKKSIAANPYDWQQDSFPIDQNTLATAANSAHEMSLLPLMYQTGYLTLDKEAFQGNQWYLKVPNDEVKMALSPELLDTVLDVTKKRGTLSHPKVLAALRDKDWVSFLNIIRYDCIAPMHFKLLDGSEKSYHAMLHAFLSGVMLNNEGLKIISEQPTVNGLADIVIEDSINKRVYVLELKVNRSSEEALGQIIGKKYHERYLSNGDNLFLIGLNFTTQKEGIDCDRNITTCSILTHGCGAVSNFEYNGAAGFREIGTETSNLSEGRGKG